ncbi:hypothetical protein BDR22DRAFT_568090 [Usnea florida]
MAFHFLLPSIEEARTESCTSSLHEGCRLASSRSASESYPVHSHALPVSAEDFALNFDVPSPDVTPPFPRSHTSASASDSDQSVGVSELPSFFTSSPTPSASLSACLSSTPQNQFFKKSNFPPSGIRSYCARKSSSCSRRFCSLFGKAFAPSTPFSLMRARSASVVSLSM